jgi:hypothetical protein
MQKIDIPDLFVDLSYAAYAPAVWRLYRYINGYYRLSPLTHG